MLNLADRGFFSMDRWIRFSATGAHLCWRVKNSARSVPFEICSRPCLTARSWSYCTSRRDLSRRRRDTGDRTAPGFAGTVARLVQFTVVTRTRSGRTKSSVIRVLTTLLDHAAFSAAGIAALYAERWQVEIAYLHLKKTLRGARRVLRGQSEVLARQEVWAFLLVHNMIATLAARAAALHSMSPTRSASPPCWAWSALTCRPIPAARTAAGALSNPLARLLGVIAHPRNRADRRQTCRPYPSRTAHQAHRRSHVYHHDHAVKSPAMGRISRKLRAVGSRARANAPVTFCQRGPDALRSMVERRVCNIRNCSLTTVRRHRSEARYPVAAGLVFRCKLPAMEVHDGFLLQARTWREDPRFQPRATRECRSASYSRSFRCWWHWFSTGAGPVSSYHSVSGGRGRRRGGQGRPGPR